MNKKNRKNIICNLAYLVVVIALLYRVGVHFFAGSFLYAAGWLFPGMIGLWIIWAFKYDKDIPGVGPYRYEDGNNQTGRGIYAVAMVVLLVVGFLHG